MTQEEQIKQKDFEISISISSDYYSASISVDINNPEAPITRDKIIEALRLKNVTFGLDYDAIDIIIQNSGHARGVTVARGIPHENGKDGEITYYVDLVKEFKPKILENGNVDFKDTSFVKTVQVGTLLASKTLPTEGRNGTTVTNKIIKAKPGKPVLLKYGKNVNLSADELSISSAINGSVQFDGEKISVIETLDIQGDVGPKTGNIHFGGKVFISGNVLSGYEIECTGDLEIRGVVESAMINCSSNVTIGMGVQGNEVAVLKIGGSLIANFLNNCEAHVKGNIETNSVLNCNIVCDSGLYVKGRQGLIVGGELDVKREVIAKTIGTDAGINTVIRMGIDSHIIDEYKVLTDEIKSVKENLTKMDQLVALTKRQSASDPGNQGFIDMYNKAQLSREQYAAEFTELSKRFTEMNEFMNELQDARVTATLIHSGTKVKIGNAFYHVKNSMKNVEIRKDGGQIVAIGV